MKPVMVDLGFPMARLEEIDDKPILTICWPEEDGTAAGSIMLYDTEGLFALAAALTDYLSDWSVLERARRDDGPDVP